MKSGRIKGEEKFHMNVEKFQESMYELIVETSTQLPRDVRRAIKVAKEKESL
jgi:fumarate hydratase class I